MQRNHNGVKIILTSPPSTEGPSPEYNFHAGHSTVRSPLLVKSWLVFSFPRSDMLKLSGWSFPIRGLMRDLKSSESWRELGLEKISL